MLKPKRISLGRPDIVTGPEVSADAVYAGITMGVTVRLDRRELREVWDVYSEDFGVGQTIGDAFLTVSGPGVGGVRSTADGRLLWKAPSRFSGASVWQQWVVVDSERGIELRDPATGELSRVHAVPGGYRGRGLTCGSSAILQTHRIVKAFDLDSGQITGNVRSSTTCRIALAHAASRRPYA